MTKAGFESIEKAKKNGSWTILDEVEDLFIPEDLEAAFDQKPGSKDFFISLSKSAKKLLLFKLVFAKEMKLGRKGLVKLWNPVLR